MLGGGLCIYVVHGCHPMERTLIGHTPSGKTSMSPITTITMVLRTWIAGLKPLHHALHWGEIMV